MKQIPNYVLSNGVEIPVIGFGTWQTPAGDVAEQSVLWALQSGYTHIDTAAIYGNEESVGAAIKKSGLKREDLFITTKLWNSDHSYEKAKAAFQLSLDKLGLDYIDLYLIHWPNPKAYRTSWQVSNQEAWRAMEELYQEGKIRAIGVSNFHKHHLDSLMETAVITPMLNQIYLSPSDMQAEVVKANQSYGILTEAYSPLGTGKIFAIEELARLADKYQKSIAQLVLRWSLQHHYLPLPKSVTQSRIEENIDIFDFEIDAEDMLIIDGLHGKAGLASNPDDRDF